MVCVCVCVFIKLHITAQSGPVLYSFYAIACNPPRGLLFVDTLLATNARAYSNNSSRRETDKQGAPRPTLLVTSPSKPNNLASPIKPCNVLQQWYRHSAPFPFQHPIVACPDYTRTHFFLRKKIPASHRARGGTPTASLALGANREGKERSRVKLVGYTVAE